ncbi:exosortase-associated protein EpsI, V-type [Polymorphobacter sp.]|uniref:exosortase-associated protein EpsI, V-type n=1 Tax=Polymorphobacter sp. TaxID=1909290 RepID=UPI003F72529B
MNRRDMLMGGGMLAAAGAALALMPRQRLLLLPEERKLEDLVPNAFGGWTTTPSDNFVLPRSEGSLADRLYNQTLSRLYIRPGQPPIMLVIAYGAVQNDQLQLHRPEVCYTAVGFEIVSSALRALSLGGTARLPVRDLEAVSTNRIETISYWTRIGDDLPTDGGSQRMVKLRQQMRGYLADGVLVRMSVNAEPSESVHQELAAFAVAMIRAIRPADRQALIGRDLAAGMVA